MNIKQAKSIPLTEYLSRLGFTPVKTNADQAWYLSPLRTEDTPSFKVNQSMNMWYDFGSGEGGSIIDLAQQLNQVSSISEALASISRVMGTKQVIEHEKRQVRQSAPKEATEEMAFGPIQSSELIDYLRKRGIDPEQAKLFLQEATYTSNGRSRSALAFANDLQGYELRSPNYKRSFGRKAITTIEKDPSVVNVFEGFFDFLSWLMITGGNSTDSVIVMNSVSMKEPLASQLVHMNATTVNLFRDRDPAGDALLSFLTAEFHGHINDMSSTYLPCKDLNEWHVHQIENGSPSPRLTLSDLELQGPTRRELC